MKTLYSVLGFPVTAAPAVGDLAVTEKMVFYSEEVNALVTERKQDSKPTFTVELAQIAVLTKVWEATGGFFKPLVGDVPAKVSVNVMSFITETARVLNTYPDDNLEGTYVRRVDFSDWRMLLEPSDSEVYSPGVPPTQAAAVDALAEMPTERLIQHWINRMGVSDLVASLNLYVGIRPSAD